MDKLESRLFDPAYAARARMRRWTLIAVAVSGAAAALWLGFKSTIRS